MDKDDLIRQFNSYKERLASLEKRLVELSASRKAREEERQSILQELSKQFGIQSREELATKIEQLAAEAEKIMGAFDEEFKKAEQMGIIK